MNEVSNFINRIKNISGNMTDLSIDKARLIIKEINEFLFTNYEDIGTTDILGNSYKYFSDFHKFWEKNHKEILNIQIDEEKCRLVAEKLHEVFVRTNGIVFRKIYDTNGLCAEDICKVRILTANQDFRGSRSFKQLSDVFIDDGSIFDLNKIFTDPESFVKDIGITGLSQNDKRVQYAKNIAKFILDNHTTPYEIIHCFDNNVKEFKNALICSNSGYGNKKADMFIRDMIVLGIWKDIVGFDQIDVASDINTIKVALRTGIMFSAIPLVSSFLDIFCYQYSYVDEMNAKAWRKVWKIWNSKYPEETIASPCLLDYFVYNVVGKQFCKPNLFLFQCDEEKHRFFWHSGRNKTCQICYKKGKHNYAHSIDRIMPCEGEHGAVFFEKSEFYRSNVASPNYDNCPFKSICDQNNCKELQPPASISILGQTGWTNAYAKKENGGGGIMG